MEPALKPEAKIDFWINKGDCVMAPARKPYFFPYFTKSYPPVCVSGCDTNTREGQITFIIFVAVRTFAYMTVVFENGFQSGTF